MQISTKDTEGKVAFNALSFHEPFEVLLSSLQFDIDAPHRVRRRIFLRALTRSLGGRHPSLSSLLREVRSEERKYLNLKPKGYSLVTGISIHRDHISRTIRRRFGLEQIFISPVTPKNFDLSSFFLNGYGHVLQDWPSKYSHVAVRTHARDIDSGADQCIEALHLFLSLLNFSMNSNVSTIYHSGVSQPINSIRTAREQILFDGRGRVEEQIWYDPLYVPASRFAPVDKKLDNALGYMNVARKAIYNMSLGSELKRIYLMYFDALSHPDHDVALLKLWTILEVLTNTGSERYESTIRRAAFFYKDRDYVIDELKMIRDLRNSFVHRGKTTDSSPPVANQLRAHVEKLIRFLTLSGAQFESLEEVGSFLDFPTERNRLIRQAELLNLALRFKS